MRQLVSDDPRPPVLYLRPFSTDRNGSAFGSFTPLLPMTNTWYTSEESIAAAFEEYGPAVAVGDPNDRLGRSGFRRAYLRDQDWRGRVRDWMGRARLVVFWAADSPGLWEEVAIAAETVPRSRVLFLLGTDQDQWYPFVSALIGRWGLGDIPLPKRRSFLSPNGIVAGVLSFPSTTPRITITERSWRPWNPATAEVSDTLRRAGVG